MAVGMAVIDFDNIFNNIAEFEAAGPDGEHRGRRRPIRGYGASSRAWARNEAIWARVTVLSGQ